MKIGFVGIGRMGLPIVERLLRAGHRVTAFDVDARARAAAAAAGAALAESPAAIAAETASILVCVPGPKEVAAVLDGPGGVFETLRPESVIVEMSSIGVAQGRALAARAGARGAAFLDAPLSGGQAGAAAGTLAVTVGGDAAALDRVRPVLDTFCSHVFHVGASGNGYLAKAINQIVYLSYVASFCEATALGARGGLDVPTLLAALRVSVAGDPLMMTRWDTHLESGELTPGFHIRRVIKDLEMGEEACRDLGFPAAILGRVLDTYRDLAARGYAECDMTAVYQDKRGALPPG